MTKKYIYRFTTYKTVLGALTTEDHELKVVVTDRMEPRDAWKRGYAVNKINGILKDKYGYKKCIQGWEVDEDKQNVNND